MPALIIEDDPPSARLVWTILVKGGCDVRLVRSAEEALALLGAFAPRVVITDICLPQMSGFLLAHRIKNDPATAHITVIGMTSSTEHDDDATAVRSGCAALIRKPIDAATFVRTVADLVNGGRDA